MDRISQNTTKTAVNIFFTLVFSMTSVALAQNSSSNSNSNSNNNNNSSSGGGYYDPRYACKQYRDDLREAQDDLNKLCKDGGVGRNCVERVDSCASDAGGDGSLNLYSTAAMAAGGSSSTMGNMLGIMGQSNAASSSCPQYSFQDYFTKKDKYTDDLDDTSEKLLNIADEQTKAQEDFNKEITDLQKDLNEAQKELEDKNMNIDEEKRQQISDFQKAQNEAKESLRQQGTDLLKSRGALITSQRDKALRLIAMTDASGKRACMKTVREMQKDYQGTLSGLSSNTMIAKAKRQEADLIAAWNDCMSSFDQQRTALLESKKQEEDLINKQIQDTQESMAQTQDTLDLAQSQLTEMQTASDTKKSQAQQNLVKTMQSIQSQMTAAKQKLESTLKSLASKQDSYNQKINRLNTSISSLGVAPPSGATTTPSAISDEINSKNEQIIEIQSYVDETCGTGTQKKGSGSQRGAS
ncbi:hypothetical protein [Bdellovibrio sp. HCB209]|uniref:hypothetical protein n=1 Tax=Bdellovibrio sp. HCB209 TaxID=3394354 RepID=UPI0039B3F7E7